MPRVISKDLRNTVNVTRGKIQKQLPKFKKKSQRIVHAPEADDANIGLSVQVP